MATIAVWAAWAGAIAPSCVALVRVCFSGWMADRADRRRHEEEIGRQALIRHVIDEHGPGSVQGLKDVL